MIKKNKNGPLSSTIIWPQTVLTLFLTKTSSERHCKVRQRPQNNSVLPLIVRAIWWGWRRECFRYFGSLRSQSRIRHAREWSHKDGEAADSQLNSGLHIIRLQNVHTAAPRERSEQGTEKILPFIGLFLLVTFLDHLSEDPLWVNKTGRIIK